MDTKQKIELFFKDNLINGYEIKSMEYKIFLNDKGEKDEDEHILFIKIQKEDQEICMLELFIYGTDRDMIDIVLDKNALKNFKEIFADANVVLTEMVSVANDLAFIHAYCFGKSYKVKLTDNLENLITRMYHGTESILGINYPEEKYTLGLNIYKSSIKNNVHLDLNKMKIEHCLEIYVTIDDDEDKSFRFFECKDYSLMRKEILLKWAANPLNKDISMIQLEDYKILPMMYY